MSTSFDNSGYLLRNTSGKGAEYTGKITVAGVEYWLNAWVKTGKEGSKLAGRQFFSVAVQPCQQPAQTAAPQGDQDIPF